MAHPNAVASPIEGVIRQMEEAKSGSGPLGLVENMFDSIGLMRGWYAPLGRAAFGGAVGYVLVKAIQPSIMFDEAGRPRPWSFSENTPEATSIPYWFIPLGFAAVSGLLI